MNPPLSPPQDRLSWQAQGRWELALALVVALCAAFLWNHQLETRFLGFISPDAFDYSQMGRQLAHGEGFTSLATTPYELAWLHERGLDTGPPWPNLTRFPLPALLRALSFRILGETATAAIIPAAFAFIGTAVLLLRLGNRLFGAASGVAASLLFLTSGAQLASATSGLTETGAAFFLCLSAWVVVRAIDAEADSLLWPFAVGATLGVAFLYRSNLIFAAPGAALALAWCNPRAAWRPVGLAAIGGLAALAPWMLHNWISVGAPLPSLTNERALMLGAPRNINLDIFGSFRQFDPVQYWLNHPERYAEVTGLSWLGQHLPTLYGPGLLWLTPGVLLAGVALRKRDQRLLWAFAILAAAFTILVFSYAYTDVRYRSNPRYHQPYAPLLWLFVVGGVSEALRRFPIREGVRAALLVTALAALAWGPSSRQGGLVSPALTGACDAIHAALPSDAIIASNRPTSVAWSCQRSTVYVTGAPPTLEMLDRDYLRIDAILIRFGYGPPGPRFADAFPDTPLGKHFARTDTGVDYEYLWIRRDQLESAGTSSRP